MVEGRNFPDDYNLIYKRKLDFVAMKKKKKVAFLNHALKNFQLMCFNSTMH